MFGKKNNLPVKGGAPTYVGHGMKIEGNIRCIGPIRIDGEVHGKIDCKSEVTIGPTAHIVATIHAAKTVVNGKVEGNLFTTDHLEILSEGYIIGNVTNPSGCLIVHEGAIIEGQCLTFHQSPKQPEPKTVSADPKKLLSDGEPKTPPPK